MTEISSLPEGAEYREKERQATVSIKRKGDNVIVVSECDSLYRQCLTYMAERNDYKAVVDSLTNELSAQRNRHSKITQEENSYKKVRSWSFLRYAGVFLIGVAIGAVGNHIRLTYKLL